MGSVRSALSARACRIRAETKGRGGGPPVSVQVSGPLSVASRVVYKTAALPAELHRREIVAMVADRPPGCENRPLTCGLSRQLAVTGMPDAAPELPGWHR